MFFYPETSNKLGSLVGVKIGGCRFEFYGLKQLVINSIFQINVSCDLEGAGFF